MNHVELMMLDEQNRIELWKRLVKVIEEYITKVGNHTRVAPYLDADKIREVCLRHSIPVHTHYRASGGTDLATVVTLRNHLAHGNISFAECGRDYTVDQIERIKRQLVTFVGGILRNIADYIDSASYEA